ncbi:NTP transferase domain-containing protein [Clostridium uliginosum]|uniref:phosphocholine cytidylyltransferase family protein n=1 Tax=Clostridium uliginosum TaxID=119641 RepID=UPI000B7FB35C|nr:phosphocholine cytidylyltransferase family protein [Clostridium uliginosum]
MKRITTAVILAAGMGTRISEITNDKIPKGFISISGISLVERSISKLKKVGIDKIYIVTGHLNHFYDEIVSEGINIYTKKNENYKCTGSMGSLAILENELKEDFLLLESDLVYEISALVNAINYPQDDCIMLSGKTNSGDECYVEIKNNNLYKISKNIKDIEFVYGELVGISKISLKLYKEMLKEYKNSNIEQYHYEYAIFDVARKSNVGYLKVDDLVWAEIDDKNQLERVRDIIMPKLYKKGEE